MPSFDVAQKYRLFARWYILGGVCALLEVCAGAAARSAVDRGAACSSHHRESMLKM